MPQNYFPGIEFNLDGGFIWEEPNDEFLHHDLIKLPNGNYMGIVDTTKFGPIPLGSWTELCPHYGYWADGMTEEIPWVGNKIIEWNSDTEVVWSWSVFDHFSMDDFDSGLWENFCGVENEYDWTHINAIVFNDFP